MFPLVSLALVIAANQSTSSRGYNETSVRHHVAHRLGQEHSLVQRIARLHELSLLGEEPSRSAMRSLDSAAVFESLPIAGVYVINMADEEQRFHAFVDHVSNTSGIGSGRVSRFLGVNPTDEVLASAWVRELLPGFNETHAKHNPGNLGCALAHMTLWQKISASAECQGDAATDKFALVFEDDERPKESFVTNLASIMRFAVQNRSSVPDYILLNAKRPSGEAITGHNLPAGIDLIRIPKKRQEKPGKPNAWASAYLVRCGAAASLLRQLPRSKFRQQTWDGIHPIVDLAVTSFFTMPDNNMTAWVVSPEGAISMHVEGFDARKRLTWLAKHNDTKK